MDKSGFDRCQKNPTYQNAELSTSVKPGEGGIMAWCCFSRFGLGLLAPEKGLLNAKGYEDISANWAFTTLWQEFGEGPYAVPA